MVTNNDILPNYDGLGMTSSAKADYDVALKLIYRFLQSEQGVLYFTFFIMLVVFLIFKNTVLALMA